MSEPAWWESFNDEVRRREQRWSEKHDEKLSKVFMDEYNKTMKEVPVTRPTHDDYLNLILGRLRQGDKEYGDRSFDKQLSKIVEEMIEEIADVAGWGYILYCKLVDLRGMMVALESPDPKAALAEAAKEHVETKAKNLENMASTRPPAKAKQLDLFKDPSK